MYKRLRPPVPEAKLLRKHEGLQRLFVSIHKEKMVKIPYACYLPKETIT